MATQCWSTFQALETKDIVFLTLKKVTIGCTIEELTVPTQNPTKEEIQNHVAWTEFDFIYKNLILNGLIDELYDYYNTISTPEEVWDALQKKYDIEEINMHEDMPLNEQFQVVIINKLPLLWKDSKNTLRHKTKEFSLESLITQLRIEEEARKHGQKKEVNVVPKKKSIAVLKPDLKPKRNKMKV
ncbi:hypothetical protein E5676_scaffold1607G00870 [Cucumis melo var. makuwa]|nr:hypothetical protein E5676_scaffold1607G00870 [Cucumis melo var. makuwa]